MFKKNLLTSKANRTYTIGNLKKEQNGVKIQKVTNQAGEELLCYSLDLATTQFKKAQIEEFVACPSIMESMHHPNILKIHDKILTEKELHLIVSNFDMNIEELILKNEIANPEQYFKLMGNIFLNVYELIKKFKFKKNNISLQNIFIKNFDIIVGGWDLGAIGQVFFQSSLGNFYYRSPEYLKGEELNIEKNDIWSMGVCLYSIYFGQIPFKAVEQEDLIPEIDNWNKQSQSIFNHSSPISKLITSMLEIKVDSRINFISFKEEFFAVDPTSKITIKRKTGAKKLHNFESGDKNTQSIINEITDLNLKKKIETNLSTSMEMPGDESYSLPNSANSFSSLSMLSLSQSNGSTSYILTSEDEINDELLRYLFEKNKIIFIMDGFKQVDICIEIQALQPIKNNLHYLGLLLIKRAFVDNYYIFRLMESNFNIFNLESYERISTTNAFSDIKSFFKDFIVYIKDMFYKMLPRYVANDPTKKKQIETFEKLNPNDINMEIAKSVSGLLEHYKSVQGQIKDSEKKELMKSCMFWYLLQQNFHTFEKFPRTDDWIDFCQEIEEKSADELEKLILKSGL